MVVFLEIIVTIVPEELYRIKIKKHRLVSKAVFCIRR